MGYTKRLFNREGGNGEETAKQRSILGEELQFMLQIQTCEEVLFTIMNTVRQRGTTMHLLTVEDIITFIHRMELDFRTELLHVNFEGELSGGWTFNYVITGGDNMVMGVYSRVKVDESTEYALVNKGTDSWSDAVNDAQQPFGKSDDMKASISNSEYFVANQKDNEITMVGHSKGG
jgi:hypothetical protein